MTRHSEFVPHKRIMSGVGSPNTRWIGTRAVRLPIAAERELLVEKTSGSRRNVDPLRHFAAT